MFFLFVFMMNCSKEAASNNSLYPQNTASLALLLTAKNKCFVVCFICLERKKNKDKLVGRRNIWQEGAVTTLGKVSVPIVTSQRSSQKSAF